MSPTADKPGREKGEVCHGVEEKSCGSSAVWVSSRGYRHQGLNHRGGVVDLKSKPNMSKNMFTYLSLSLSFSSTFFLSFFFFFFSFYRGDILDNRSGWFSLLTWANWASVIFGTWKYLVAIPLGILNP